MPITFGTKPQQVPSPCDRPGQSNSGALLQGPPSPSKTKQELMAAILASKQATIEEEATRKHQQALRSQLKTQANTRVLRCGD